MVNKQFGKLGEKIALLFLLSNGYKLKQRNWTMYAGELDLILIDQKNNTLVFCEVKYRKNTNFGQPHESMNIKKIKSQKRAVFSYLRNNNLENSNWRYDLICIVSEKEEMKLQHFQNLKLI